MGHIEVTHEAAELEGEEAKPFGLARCTEPGCTWVSPEPVTTGQALMDLQDHHYQVHDDKIARAARVAAEQAKNSLAIGPQDIEFLKTLLAKRTEEKD